MAGKPVSNSIVTMTEMVLPTHTNALGSVFGGTIMSWIDIAAAISAQRHSSRPCVTASIDSIDFIAPVYRGWVVVLKACVNYVGKTSMEVGVRVEAQNSIEDKYFHMSSAYLTFVCLGNDGRPMSAPPLICESDLEKRRFEAASKRRKMRLDHRHLFKNN